MAEGYSPQAQGWHRVGPYSSTVVRQIRDNTRQELQQKADSMTPDTQKLTESLLKHELSGADNAYFTNKLNALGTEYLTNYTDNPYFAFSKKGRDLAKSMQRVASDPNNTIYSSLYKSAVEEKKRMQSNLGMVNYDKGSVKMLNKSTGKIEDVQIGNIDYATYRPLTGGEEFNYRTNVSGFNFDPTEFRMNQEDYSKVVDKIDKFLGNTGDYKVQELYSGKDPNTGEPLPSLLSSINANNFSQIKSKANLIKSSVGLSESELNSIYARYYTSKLMSQEKPTQQEADRFLIQMVDEIKSGHLKSSQTYAENPIFNATTSAKKASGAGGDGPLTELGAGSAAIAGLTGGTTLAYNFNNNPRAASIAHAPLSGTVLQNSTGQNYKVKTASGEESYPKINMKTLKVSQATQNDKAMMLDMDPKSPNYGMPSQSPLLAKYQDQIVPKEMGLVRIPYKVDERGQKVYLPLSTSDPDAQMETVMRVKGDMGYINPKGGLDAIFGGMPETDREIQHFIDKYKVGDPRIYESSAKEFQDYTNNAYFSEDRYGVVDESGSFGADDELNLYTVEYFLPIQGDDTASKGMNIDRTQGVNMLIDKGFYNTGRPLNSTVPNLPPTMYPKIDVLK